MIDLRHGDCLEIMKAIPYASIDAVITDPPYGTTACKWDSVIPFELMWSELKRITKDNAAIIFTASQPFTSNVVMSNIKMFKHEWIWEKNRGSNFATLKYAPMKEHESVLVFCKTSPKYFPIMQERKGAGDALGNLEMTHANHNGNNELRYPSSIQKFNTEVGKHPTQKPVTLMEYLVKTYTQENDIVLDFTMGSGTTGIACKNLNRNFIGIELDETYFKIAQERINAN